MIDDEKAEDTLVENQEEQPAEDKLDALLASYEASETQPEQPEPKTAGSDLTKADLLEMRDYVQRDKVASVNRAIDASVQEMKIANPELQFVPDSMLADLYYAKMSRDMSAPITQAFLQRETNPKAYKKIVAALGKEFAEALSPVDQKATEDRKAVRQSVRGTTTHEPVDDDDGAALKAARGSSQAFRKYCLENNIRLT